MASLGQYPARDAVDDTNLDGLGHQSLKPGQLSDEPCTFFEGDPKEVQKMMDRGHPEKGDEEPGPHLTPRMKRLVGHARYMIDMGISRDLAASIARDMEHLADWV